MPQRKGKRSMLRIKSRNVWPFGAIIGGGRVIMVPKKIFWIQKGTPSFFSPIFCEFKSGLILGFGQNLIHPRDFFETLSEKALKVKFGA